MVFCVEPPNQALLPSPVNDVVYTRAILPSSLRPSLNTPSYIPSWFPTFPPKYTYSYTPSYPPRPVDPEDIRNKAVLERDLLDKNLERLMNLENQRLQENPPKFGEARDKREEVWWEAWKELGCDVARIDIWPLPKIKRELQG